MRATSTLIVSIFGYALLLLAPGVLPSAVSFGGYLLLALAWLGTVLWLVWRVQWRAFLAIMSGVAVVALVAFPFNAIVVGCYVFNECP